MDTGSSDEKLLQSLRDCLRAASKGEFVDVPQVTPDNLPVTRELAEASRELLLSVRNLWDFSLALSNGNLGTTAPARNNLLAPLKALQASLLHLTWQTQEIAAGRLEHRVDFLGEFSQAFNQMTESLRSKARAEREAMEAARHASIGQLASGVAHEINTPMQYISTNLEFALYGLRQCSERSSNSSGQMEDSSGDCSFPDVVEALAEALSGVRKISGVILALAEFARPVEAARSEASINKILETALELSRSSLRDIAEVAVALTPDLPPVLCHSAELGRVLVNLIMNAAGAIRDAGRSASGKIKISSGRLNERVVVRIEDNGKGISSEALPHLFDPFFTAENVGKGLGLGLAMAHKIIVGELGGDIKASSEEGTGAVFTIELPACTKNA